MSRGGADVLCFLLAAFYVLMSWNKTDLGVPVKSDDRCTLTLCRLKVYGGVTIEF